MLRLGRRAAPLALLCLVVLAPFTLRAVAQQVADWTSALRWSDGKEVQWRSTAAPGCDGSNVELRLVNNSNSSGTGKLANITFACKRGGQQVGPERTLASVAPGGTYSSETLNCACAEKGGVKDLLSVELSFTRNGEGAETLANGCSYTGNYINGQRNGKGVYSCPDGYRYEGNYTADQIDGQGAETLPGGQKYAGAFVNGERHGAGRMTYTDSSVYEGNFVRNLRDGTGTQKFRDGSTYIGEWKGDRRNGQGSYTTGDQQWTYDGGWLNDMRSGDGRLLSTDGAYTYLGPFVNDKRTGQGIANFGDGRVFRGAFVNDKQVGPGELTFKDGRKVTGDFNDHRPHGHAVETGGVATFDGQWVDGMLQGKAVVVYATGERFDGLYARGQRNGLGVETRKDGSKEECQWIADIRQQPCTQITKDGKRIEFRSNKPKGRN